MAERETAEGPGRERSLVLGAVLALAAGAFVADRTLALGDAAALLYLVPVLAAAWRAGPRDLVLLAALASLLAAAGAWGIAPLDAGAVIGRGLAIAAIWACAGLVLRARREARALAAERAALRARLAEQGARLAAARTHAELANRSASQIMAGMSHELRTPLNAIIGFSEIIKNEMFGPVGSERYRDYMRDINRSGAYLLELVNDLLDMARIESGQVALSEQAIDVPALVRDCAAQVAAAARAGGLTLSVEAAGDLPPLRADRAKVRRILLDLLANAIKFTPPGGSVRLAAWARPETGYVFQVSDRGIGIALADIPTAFAPFGQIPNPLREAHEGSGLGLPLAKALVELHAGSIDLQSEPHIGTTVTVRFPAERLTAIARVA